MLKNQVYCGKIRRGWCKQVKRIENGEVKRHIKHLRDPSDYEIFQGLHPPLISEDIFTEAQRIRTERSPNAHVKVDFELQNAFTGLIFCAMCSKRIGRTISNRGVSPGSGASITAAATPPATTTPRPRSRSSPLCANGKGLYGGDRKRKL